MKYGYLRPFAEEELNNLQDQLLQKIGHLTLFIEKHSKANKRVQLDKLLDAVKPGDEIYVYNLYALADSTRQLLEIVQILSSRDVYVHFLENQLNTLQFSKYSLMDILEELTKFQSEAISEKTKIGLLEAQKKGHNVGRPRKSVSTVNLAIEMYHSKQFSLEEITAKTGISKSTLYRNLET